jgi:hypothetical protein
MGGQKMGFVDFALHAWAHSRDRWETTKDFPKVSPCCSAKIMGATVGTDLVGVCSNCRLRVLRWSPKAPDAYMVRVMQKDEAAV